MKTSLIIPIYLLDKSFYEMTVKCLDSLQYGRPDEVIVVDDGSPFQKYKLNGLSNNYLFLAQNRGYAGAVNAGLENATGKILIVANNDIEFTPGWLEAITEPLQNGYDLCSIRTSDGDGYETEDKITEGDKYGSIVAFTRNTYNKLGGFDTSYGKGYFSDLDHRRRAIEAGLRIAKNHAAVVEHVGKATFKVVDTEDEDYEQAKQKYIKRWGFLE